MPWHALECGIHEETRPVEPCRTCAAAERETAKALGSVAPTARAKRAARETQRNATERVQRAKAEAEMRRRFTSEEKAAAVARVDAGEKIGKVAQSLSCSIEIIRLWRKGKALPGMDEVLPRTQKRRERAEAARETSTEPQPEPSTRTRTTDADERTRLRHYVATARTMLDGLDIALGMDAPIGADVAQHITGHAVTIAMTISRADAYRRAGSC